MKCKCGGETEVFDSRAVVKSPTGIENSVRRRRGCVKCSERFTTYEIRMDEETLDMRVDGLDALSAELVRRICEIEKVLKIRRDFGL